MQHNTVSTKSKFIETLLQHTWFNIAEHLFQARLVPQEPSISQASTPQVPPVSDDHAHTSVLDSHFQFNVCSHSDSSVSVLTTSAFDAWEKKHDHVVLCFRQNENSLVTRTGCHTHKLIETMVKCQTKTPRQATHRHSEHAFSSDRFL